VRVVFSGAGAAGFAMAKFLLALGVRREHLVLTDAQGVVYAGRGDGNFLEELVADTDARTLAEVAAGVAEAALQTGVAAVGLHLGAYREDLRHLAMSL
jgi:malic enzyme